MLGQHLASTGGGTRLKSLRRSASLMRAHLGDFESRLVWILGSPRTGSTWLMNLLNEHSAVVAVDEPLIGWHLGPFLCDIPGADPSHLSSANFMLRQVQVDRHSQFFAEEFSDAWMPGLARMMRERFFAEALGRSTAARGERVVLIKEPNGSQSADLISRALPRSRLLFLLRDGRDVVDSELAGNLPDSWITREFPGLGGIADEQRLAFVIQSAHKWLWRTEIVQEAIRRHSGPTFVTRYEDLLANPKAELTKICNWVGLKVGEQNLDHWIDRHAFMRVDAKSRGPLEFHREAAPGSWEHNLRTEEKVAIDKILGGKLRELGYPPCQSRAAGNDTRVSARASAGPNAPLA